MNKLLTQINKIPKKYYSLTDLKKVSQLGGESLKVALSRLIKNNLLFKLAPAMFTVDPSLVDWEKFALEAYGPSYLSCEWILAKNGILSQKTYSPTMVTSKRSRVIKNENMVLIYHHLKPELFFGYTLEQGLLEAEPEKAFLDLLYLSLRGYAKFDQEEMNLDLLDKIKLKKYLKRFENKKMENMVAKIFK